MKLAGQAQLLVKKWRRQWVPLAISLSVTLASLFIYRRTFVGEQVQAGLEFVHRLELASLDARFQLRGRTTPDPRIVVVAIDQRSQEEWGRWPFPRIHFVKLIEKLRAEGARVVAFDVAFSQPDQTVEPLRALEEQLATAGPSARAAAQTLREQYDYDRRLADAVRQAGNVVLGNFFFFDEREVKAISADQLRAREDLLENFALPEIRPRPSSSAAQDLAGTVEKFREFFGLPLGVEVNLAALMESAANRDYGMGFFNVRADPDGVVRQTLFVLPYAPHAASDQWSFYGSLEVQAVRAYLGQNRQRGIVNLSDTGIENLELGSGIVVHSNEVGQATINFRGKMGDTYPYVSMVSVVRGETPAGFFRDKIVLVGATALGIADIRATPYGRLDSPGVEIRANAIDNILHHDFLERGALQNLVDEGMIFLFGVPLGLWLAVVRPRWTWFSILLLVPFSLGVTYAFSRGWWLNAVMPALFTLVPNTIFVSLYRILVEEREKRRIRGAFQQYLSPEVIRRLLDNPALVNPRKVEITIIFSDIRGFTALSEKLDAQQLAALLNHYLTEMTRIVFQHRGTLDKYIGDALMAFWGAPFEEPGHAGRACRSALEMLARLDSLQGQWRAQGHPVFDIGVGIHTGVAAVGNMGSQLRYGYTAVGDSVNLSSRLEGLNKLYGTRILATESTVHKAAEHGERSLLFRELDLIRVKGKQEPVLIYELMGDRDQVAQETRERCAAFAEGRSLYTRRDWTGAKKVFDDILRQFPEDGPARLFSENSAKCMLAEPPADWDGVFTLDHK